MHNGCDISDIYQHMSSQITESRLHYAPVAHGARLLRIRDVADAAQSKAAERRRRRATGLRRVLLAMSAGPPAIDLESKPAAPFHAGVASDAVHVQAVAASSAD